MPLAAARLQGRAAAPASGRRRQKNDAGKIYSSQCDAPHCGTTEEHIQCWALGGAGTPLQLLPSHRQPPASGHVAGPWRLPAACAADAPDPLHSPRLQVSEAQCETPRDACPSYAEQPCAALFAEARPAGDPVTAYLASVLAAKAYDEKDPT